MTDPVSLRTTAIASYAANQQPEFTYLRYLALATDYDGTLATDGQLSEEAIGAVKRLRASGRRVILVTGRRLVIFDEAHHVLPLDWGHLSEVLPQQLGETVFVTVRPDHLESAILAMIDVIIAVGPFPETTMKSFSEVTSRPLLWPQGLAHKAGQAVIWFPGTGKPPYPMSIQSSSHTRSRIENRPRRG